jgi:hypothetical protein
MGPITEDYPRRQGTTVTEDYVSFEIAKLLKEKGFPQNHNICNNKIKRNNFSKLY